MALNEGELRAAIRKAAEVEQQLRRAELLLARAVLTDGSILNEIAQATSGVKVLAAELHDNFFADLQD